MAVKIDPQVGPRDLLSALYSGDLVVMTKLDAVGRLVDLTRTRLEELFAPHDPQHAHEYLTPDEMAKILGQWKPWFIHSDDVNDLVRNIVVEAGFEASQTHYDVPKPRTSFPQGHLTTGIAFAFPWHRDAWYASPSQQVNWWLPIYPVSEKNAMSFDVSNFARPVPNTSGNFDYYQANSDRLTAASQVGSDNRARPGAIDHHPDTNTIILPAPGEVLLFSGAQLHTSIPNTSGIARYSIDFRTVDFSDVVAGIGAPLVDVYCSGTAIRDFMNLATSERIDESLVQDLYGAPPDDVLVIFDEESARQAAALQAAD